MKPWEFVYVGRVITAAYDVGLLEALQTSSKTAKDFADQLDLNEFGTKRFLEVLAATDMAQRDGDVYGASETLQQMRYFPGGGLEEVFRQGDAMHEFFKSGEAYWNANQSATQRESNYRDAVRGMVTLWGDAAEELAKLGQRTPEQILDIGTGSGIWSLEMAKQFPKAHVTGLDFRVVLETFQQRADELGLADRTHILPGDVHELDIPQNAFDRVMIANVLRLESPDRASALIERAAGTIAPGGDLLVIDAWPGRSDEAAISFALYSLSLASRTGSAEPHPVSDIEKWVSDAGLQVTKTTHVGGGRAGVLFASKPR